MEQHDELELLQYWQALVKRKWIILLLFVSAVVSAYIASSMMTPVYEATTTIMIKDQKSGLQMPFLEGLANTGKNPVQNYVEILKSRSLAQKTAENLGLSSDPLSPQFASFRSAISIQPVSGTDTIRISVQSTKPTEAQAIANELVRTFVKSSQDSNREEARSAREFISEQLEVVQRDLLQAEEQLQRFQEEEKIVAPSETTKTAIDKIAQLERAKADADVSRHETQIRLEKIQALLESQDPTLLSATTLTNNPLVTQFRTRLADLETQLAGARERYTDQHPTVLSLLAEIKNVQELLAAEVSRVVGSETISVNPVHQGLLQEAVMLQATLVALEARVSALADMIQHNEQVFESLPAKELQLARLIRNTKVTEEIFLMLRQRYEEVRITEAMQSASVQVIDPAITPVNPIKPKKKLNIAIAGFLGLFIGCGLALFLEYLDTTLKTAEDIERHLGLPVLGRIPSQASNGVGRQVSKIPLAFLSSSRRR